MKITAQEEYGLRILIRIADCKDRDGLSIPQLSEAEGIGSAYVAKLCRILRMADLINSTPGYKGGYSLAKPSNEIIVKNVLDALGGKLFDVSFCGDHTGTMRFCTNSVDCSARSLWSIIQITMDKLLVQITLEDLIGNPEQITSKKFGDLLVNNPVK